MDIAERMMEAVSSIMKEGIDNRIEPSPIEDVIPFGKWKGSTLEDVSPSYKAWLCCWQHMASSTCEDSDCDCDWRCYKVRKYRPQWDQDWRHNIKSKFPKHVAKARKHVKEKNLCHHCGKPLVPIGYGRSNGKGHRDWKSRSLHKKCWMEIMESPRSPRDEDVETDCD